MVLVGHSGAGPLLPVIASRMDHQPRRLVFVDATVPPSGGGASLVPEEFLNSLKGLARNGRLPKWSEWFGPGTMEPLVPGEEQRSSVVADQPQLPLSYFDGVVPMPQGWTSAEGGYVLLSEPYRSDAAQSASLGWPVRELSGSHLDIVTRAGDVADALLDLAR